MKFKVGDKVKFIEHPIVDTGDRLGWPKLGHTGVVSECHKKDSWIFINETEKQKVNNDMFIVNWDQETDEYSYLLCEEFLEKI